MLKSQKVQIQVNKVSIVPRGLAALGIYIKYSEENKYLMQNMSYKLKLMYFLVVVQLKSIYWCEISTGAGNDLERATGIIKSMATIYGMSVAGLMVLERTILGGQTGFGRMWLRFGWSC